MTTGTIPPGVVLSSPLRALPLLRWATRFDGGTIALTGRLVAPFRWPPAPHDSAFELPAGPIYVQVVFAGGPVPRVPEIRIQADRRGLVFVDGVVYTGDGDPRPLPDPMNVIDTLLDDLHDPSARVEARPSEDLWIKVAPGLSAALPAGGTITVEAETVGPPDRPVLRRPLVVSVGGAGLSIRLPGSRWLRVLASIAIRRASLAPDGGVELLGHASGTLNGAVGVGLRHASHHLSDLVRRSPQFARVRTFLDAAVAPPRGLPRKVPGEG